MAFMSEVKKDPIQSPSIELLIAPAIDNPPPNNKSIPQGSSFVVFQSINPVPFSERVIKIANAANTAIA